MSEGKKPHEEMSLKKWREKHATCGSGRGPWGDSDLGVYRVWRCGCGDAYKFSDAEEKAMPGWFATA